MMMQIQYPKTFASKGSISVFTKLQEVGFSYRLFQPLKKGGECCLCKYFCHIYIEQTKAEEEGRVKIPAASFLSS